MKARASWFERMPDGAETGSIWAPRSEIVEIDETNPSFTLPANREVRDVGIQIETIPGQRIEATLAFYDRTEKLRFDGEAWIVDCVLSPVYFAMLEAAAISPSAVLSHSGRL